MILLTLTGTALFSYRTSLIRAWLNTMLRVSYFYGILFRNNGAVQMYITTINMDQLACCMA